MNKILAALLLLLTIFVSTSAQAQGVQGLSTPELPSDADRMYLTLFDDGSETAQAVQGWFDGSLLGLRQRTRYKCVPCDREMYKERYAEENSDILIKLQAPNGDDVSVIRRDEVPMTDAALQERIRADCQRWRRLNCDNGQCRPSKPEAPTVPDKPQKPEPPAPAPVQPLPPPKPQMDLPAWVLIISVLAGAVVGLGLSYRDQYKGI